MSKKKCLISSYEFVVQTICFEQTVGMLDKNFSRQHFENFILFSQKIGFDISCKLSPCMKCQILFYGRTKKKRKELDGAVDGMPSQNPHAQC